MYPPLPDYPQLMWAIRHRQTHSLRRYDAVIRPKRESPNRRRRRSKVSAPTASPAHRKPTLTPPVAG